MGARVGVPARLERTAESRSGIGRNRPVAWTRASELLDEVDERVVHVERTAAEHDLPEHPNRLDSGVCVAERGIQAARGRVCLPADAQADAVPAARAGLVFGGVRELRGDSAAPQLGQDEDVLDLREPEVVSLQAMCACPTGTSFSQATR